MKGNRLGRGLEALIRPQDELSTSTSPGVYKIPIDKIVTNPNQPRKYFNEEALEELAASIREKGVLTPITVQAREDGFFLIAGERRWRAAQMAKLKTIPGYVVEVNSEADLMEMSLAENIQRENLNPIEEAEGYAFLHSNFGLKQQDIARSVGKKRVTVTNALRLLNLPSEIRKSLRQGDISAGHGRALLMAKTTAKQLSLWRRIRQEGLSVRQTEALAAGKSPTKPKSPRKSSAPNPAFQVVESQLRDVLGTKVKVKSGKGQGTIEISWYSEEDLDRLVELLQSISEK
ncbi:MAG: ParB/RepB/Spo0J family partition protein [Fidelibacterota bacterium]